ncbi:MAG TPA: hypothetical protein DCX95_01105 [Elusimicrobia bacterium]|nr:hypothetical protein [Elusimicrobiota bacterium]
MKTKNKGLKFETEMAFRLREVFPNCRGSRFMGKYWLDSQKVDLTDTEPFYFQCKNLARSPAYHRILSEMPQNGHINVLLHKRGEKNTVAVLDFEDFLTLLKNGKGTK